MRADCGVRCWRGVAASHIRVGTFQFFAARGEVDKLRALVDYTLARHYPQATGALGVLDAVIAVQARLIAQWMGLGFVHGVMNTDNMALSGEGPSTMAPAPSWRVMRRARCFPRSTGRGAMPMPTSR